PAPKDGSSPTANSPSMARIAAPSPLQNEWSAGRTACPVCRIVTPVANEFSRGGAAVHATAGGGEPGERRWRRFTLTGGRYPSTIAQEAGMGRRSARRTISAADAEAYRDE